MSPFYQNVAEMARSKVYPERKPFGEIDPTSREEWIKLAEAFHEALAVEAFLEACEKEVGQ